VNLLAQSALRADAEAVADDQHADHQLRIDGRSTSVAVERGEVLVQITEVQDLLNAAQQMITWDVIIKVEGVEESVLCTTSSTHHRDALRLPRCRAA